ncbi:MAG: MMPL family transporter [Gammaproteobacteria bacterium]|nr:MMPL family transporter [Gammaproteobacteria bacterium]
MKGNLFTLKSVALGWLLLVAAVTVLALRQGPAFDSSILSLLPKSDQQPLVQGAIEQMSKDFSGRLILVLSGSNDQKLRAAVELMARKLALLPDVSKVYWQVEGSEVTGLREELYPYRFSVIDTGIRNLLLAGEYQQISDRALVRLYGPLSTGGNSIIEDPFGLYFELNVNRSSELNIQISNSLLRLINTELPSYLLILTLKGDPFSSELQHRVLGAIAAQHSLMPATVKTIGMSGMLLHAAAGARQAKSEISTIGFGSLTGIVIAMLLVFRRFKPLLLLLFPVVVGCIFASAMVLLIFPRVHLVTFAFGAGLVGVSIDYALHFLCERRVSAANQVLDKILPGLLLGLFSSVIAYAAQALTPFPGLRQMATFSVLGLCASWLTVVLWFPLITRSDTEQALGFADKLDILRGKFPKLATNPGLLLLLLIILGLAMVSIWNSSSQDDIRLLQTSPASLLAQEQDLHRALGMSSSSRFLLISANTLEASLQKEEQLVTELESLKAEGVIGGFQALSSTLPSLERQSENFGLVEKLYSNQLAFLYRLIQVPQSGLSNALSIREKANGLRLTPKIWYQLAGSKERNNHIVQQTGLSAVTVIRLTGELSSLAKRKLSALSATMPGVVFVDQVQNISDLMGKYRVQVVTWIILAYLFVLIALVMRYKRQVWRIVMPPLLASVITLAILVQLEQGINLFHMMALILVLGIGLDMGIFLMETDEAPHTWLAVSLSTFTSLLAFGLLALSDTPVLHHFGLTVAMGLTLVWLFAPLMRRH